MDAPLRAPSLGSWAGSTGTSRSRWRTSRIRARSGAGFSRSSRHLLPRARRGGRRDDGRGVPEHDHPHGRSRRARADGDGDHHVHGQGVGRPPEPGVSIAFSLRGDFPLAPGARIRRRAVDRGVACRALPSRGDRGLGYVRFQLSGARLLGPARVSDGGRAHAGPRQRHPRHGVGRAERRDLRSARGRRLHRARRPVGQPDLRRVDEPGAHVRPRSRRRRLRELLGLCGRSGWAWCSRWGSRASCAAPAACKAGSAAAQGDLFTEVKHPDKA